MLAIKAQDRKLVLFAARKLVELKEEKSIAARRKRGIRGGIESEVWQESSEGC